MRLRPLFNKIIVKRVETDAVSPGGILIPDVAKEKPLEAEVVAVGPGKVLDDGSRREIPLSAGDHVLFSKYAGTEVTFDEQDYLILTDDDVIASIKPKANPAVAKGKNEKGAV